MANWSIPTITSLYVDAIAEIKGRDDDAATMFLNAPSNQPTGSIKAVRAVESAVNILKFEEWSGAAWAAKPVGLAGGGTGATTAAAARTNLGIGTMGVQAASAVAITGGDVFDVNVRIKTGGSLTFNTDNDADVGAFAKQARRLYVKSAMVIPVGADKYATS